MRTFTTLNYINKDEQQIQAYFILNNKIINISANKHTGTRCK